MSLSIPSSTVPVATAVAPSLEQAQRTCQEIARRSRSTFYTAFRTLPTDMFRDMCVLYAYLRCTDDLGDDPAIPDPLRSVALADWRAQLQRAFAGEPVAEPVTFALAEMAARRQIPLRWLEEVISGVESDLQPRRFLTWKELEGYCYQVAGVVGLCCIRIWGTVDPAVEGPALACGSAFQLTNILRDLGEDAARGRVYLPEDELQRFGYSERELRQGNRNEAYRALMNFQAERVHQLTLEARTLLKTLTPDGRRIQAAFFELYGALLHELQRSDFDVFRRRIRIPRWKKLTIGLRCLLHR